MGFILLDLFFFKRKIDLHGFGPFLVGGLIALAIAAQSKRPWSKDAALWVYVLWLAILLQFRCKITNDAPVYWTLMCMGLIGIVFGALRLRRFLRENPKAAEA
jgi:peptidoglycan/LPS O-acetylase OafA/YrhL